MTIQVINNLESGLVVRSKLNSNFSFLSSITRGDTWILVSTNYSASIGDKVLSDTSSGPLNLTLPASPSVGDNIQLLDVMGTWGTNNLTVLRNGSNIDSAASDLIANIKNSEAFLVWVNSTVGWLVV